MKEGWKVVKLGEVCKIKGGATPLRTKHEYWADGTIPWFTVDDIREQGRIISKTRKHITELGAQRLQIYPKDTILLCCTASVGEYAITKIEMASNQQFNGLMIKDKNVLFPYYLFYYVATLRDILLKLSTKTTIDFVSLTKVSQIPIPLPPLPEQHRIVKKLDAAFEKIDAMKAKAEKNIENAKALFQQTLAEELEPKEGWVEKKLGEVCEASNGLWKGKKPPYKKIAVIRNTNFSKDCKLNLENVEYIDVEERQYISRKLEYGDIIIEKSGGSDKQPVGRPILFNVLEGDFSYSNFTSRLRINDLGSVDALYLHKALYHLYLQGATSSLQSNTTGIHNLNLKGYLELDIPLPPLSEQQQIVTKLDNLSAKCKKLEEAERKTIAECDALKQAILRQAFNGEL